MACKYFETTPNQVQIINESYNTTENEVDEMVAMLKDWIKQQPHLPVEEGEVFDRQLKGMLRCNKMSTEKTKRKLDMYYSIRNLFPEFYNNREPLHPRMQKVKEAFIFFPLPKPIDDFSRLHFYKLKNNDMDLFNLTDYFSSALNLIEIRKAFDYCISEVYVMDYSNYTLGHFLRLNLIIKKMYMVFEKAYSDRIVALHFLNLPSYGETLITILKSVMKPKISNRIHVHSNLESLYEFVPKHMLPSDYGGEERPLEEMSDTWYEYVESNNDWLKETENYKSNEKLRPGKSLENELFGNEGSFRKLAID